MKTTILRIKDLFEDEQSGTKVEILDIWVDRIHLTPQVYVKYKFTNPDYKSDIEQNPIETVSEMLKNAYLLRRTHENGKMSFYDW